MKGIFFQVPLEFRLEVQGDQWQQGDSVKGTLHLKNRGTEAKTIGRLNVELAIGSLKKVKARADDAFQLVARAESSEVGSLAPGADYSFPWEFLLGSDSTISDKAQSPYLICAAEGQAAAGQLAVNVAPHEHIQALISSLENSYYFVFKEQKWQKGFVEAKFTPPLGKEYPTLEHLVLCARYQESMLDLNYRFHVKQLKASPTSLDVKKAKKEFKLKLAVGDYLFSGGQVNHQALERHIEDALATVKSRM